MKVILLQDVENLGKKFEIKEVKNGYARNFLVPNNLVKIASKLNLQWLKKQQEIKEKEIEEDLKKIQTVASAIDGTEVAIVVKVGSEGQLFESINAAKVAEQLKVMGFDIKKSQIKLDEPLKETGEFPVKISLYYSLEVEVRVVVSAETSTKQEV